MGTRIVGSILHGAYGDYYEQAVCLRSFKLSNPNIRLKLFAADEERLKELRVFDFGFADSFLHWPALEHEPIDAFMQFQVRDPTLRSEVLGRLPASVRHMLDEATNRLPWTYLRGILPLSDEGQLGLSEWGRARLPEVMAAHGLDDTFFERPTLGFLWRRRAADAAIRPFLQPPAEDQVRKYSAVFQRAIRELGCRVLVCGMRVRTTEDNRRRIDAKFPEYGLDLPPGDSVHMQGLSWGLEMEILSRTMLCLGHPSGFTEALWIRRRGGVVLVDPPPHYLLKLLRHRMPFFEQRTVRGFVHLWRLRHSEKALLRAIEQALATRKQGST